jgi:hypothetical protein
MVLVYSACQTKTLPNTLAATLPDRRWQARNRSDPRVGRSRLDMADAKLCKRKSAGSLGPVEKAPDALGHGEPAREHSTRAVGHTSPPGRGSSVSIVSPILPWPSGPKDECREHEDSSAKNHNVLPTNPEGPIFGDHACDFPTSQPWSQGRSIRGPKLDSWALVDQAAFARQAR